MCRQGWGRGPGGNQREIHGDEGLTGSWRGRCGHTIKHPWAQGQFSSTPRSGLRQGLEWRKFGIFQQRWTRGKRDGECAKGAVWKQRGDQFPPSNGRDGPPGRGRGCPGQGNSWRFGKEALPHDLRLSRPQGLAPPPLPTLTAPLSGPRPLQAVLGSIGPRPGVPICCPTQAQGCPVVLTDEPTPAARRDPGAHAHQTGQHWDWGLHGGRTGIRVTLGTKLPKD